MKMRNQFGAVEWRRLMALYLDDLERAFCGLKPYGDAPHGWGSMAKARETANWLWEARP